MGLEKASKSRFFRFATERKRKTLGFIFSAIRLCRKFAAMLAIKFAALRIMPGFAIFSSLNIVEFISPAEDKITLIFI